LPRGLSPGCEHASGQVNICAAPTGAERCRF
jgi:hypothetical protein